MEEQELAIDIHTNKLLDWLISRRHCNRDWSKNALIIREKINNAIQDMPVHEEITYLLSGNYINFFHCGKIVDILKETESESKNIFGRYSSQRMKDWVEIVNLYEKDNIYLADAAHMLIQNVKYEIPALKRQIIKLQQLEHESDKKSADYSKLAKEMKDKYFATCRQMGIKGDDIRSEFAELIKDMPSAYDSVLSAAKQLKDGIEYYAAFSEFITGKSGKDYLSILNYLIEKGNTTVYEWKYGKKPLKIEEPKLNFMETTTKSSTEEDVIDFGDIEDGSKIDFGDDNQIDFGDEIDWNNTDNATCTENVTNLNDGVAKGEEAITILDSCSIRNSFINDLCELESFLEQRVQEMQVESNLLSMNQFQSAPSIIQLQTTDKINVMLSMTRSVINLLNDVKLKQLFTIKESPRYVDRIAESLNYILVRAKNMLEHQDNSIKKGREVLEEERSLNPKLSLIIEKTKELQKMIETEISKKYKNRPVNIMGSVNIL